MDLVLLPDVEALLSVFWRAQPEMAAFGMFIGTELPRSPTFPALRLTRFSGAPTIDLPLWLDAAQVQVDVWGGPKRTANRIAETARATAAARLVGVHDEGVVTQVRMGELRWQPDDDVQPADGVARPRYLFSMTVRAHPLPSPGS